MLQCNGQNRRVMANTSTHVHRWPGVTGESPVPIHWNPSIPRSSPKHHEDHTRNTAAKSLHADWLAVWLSWLGSTCTIFATRWTPIARILTLPCTSVVPAQAHVLSAFKGIYDSAASVSDEGILTGLHVHHQHAPPC